MYQNTIEKDHIIDILLDNGLFKMPDGRQLYEATEIELKKELCANTENQYEFCTLL